MAKGINLILLLSCLDLIIMGLMLPKIGAHVLALDGSYFLIGVLGSIVAATQFISGPIAGSLSDSKGRVPILKNTLLITCLMTFLSGCSSSLTLFMICRVMCGMFTHTPVLCKALIADLTPSNEQAAIYGKMGALGALGFILGPVIGGHLYEKSNGFYIITTISSTLLLISAGITFILPDVKDKDKKEDVIENKKGKICPSVNFDISAEFRKIIGNIVSIDWSKFWDLFTLKLLTDIAVHSFFPNLVLILGAVFKQSHKNIGYSLGFMSLIMAISNILIGKLRKTFYAEDQSGLKRISHGIFFLVSSFVAMYNTNSYELYMLWLIPFSIAVATLGTTFTEVILGRADEKEKGKIMGAAESMIPLAGLITPLLSGFISEYVGQREVIYLSIVPAVVAAILVGKLRFRSMESEVEKTKTE